MQLKTLLALTLGAAAASAQSLTDALASQNATLSTLTSLIAAQPSLLNALAGLTGITILAPSNSALAAFLLTDAGKAAVANPALIAPLLTYHVLNGTYPSTAFKATPAFAHSLLTNSSYTNVTGGQVVSAKSDGTKVTIGSGLLKSSTVTTADLKFSGGVIHIIDTVLTVPVSPSLTAAAANLTGIVNALKAVNLVSTVDSLKDVTIFAPSNAAFDAIASVAANLTAAQISSVLTYHVVQGTVGYSSLLTNTTLKTVNGGSVTIKVVGGAVYVNTAKVTIADVLVYNGVVHVIDAVLIPPTNTSSTTTSSASGSASGSATKAANPSSTTKAAVSGNAGAVHTAAVGMAALFGGAMVLNL